MTHLWKTIGIWLLVSMSACVSSSACQPEEPDEPSTSPDLSDLSDADLLDHDLAPTELDMATQDMVVEQEDSALDLPDQSDPDQEDFDHPPEDQDLAADEGADLDMSGSPVEEARPYMEGEPSWGDDALVIGSGKEALEASLQGSITRWEAGPQGGYHLWVGSSIDAALLDALSDEQRATLPILYRVWRQDGTLLARTQRLGGLKLAADGRWLSIGQYAVLEAPIRPRRMDGEQLLFRVDISLPGELATRHRAVWITSQCCD